MVIKQEPLKSLVVYLVLYFRFLLRMYFLA